MAIGDTFIVDDYEYTILTSTAPYTVSAKVVDTSQESYADIPATVYDSTTTTSYRVTNLDYCFSECTEITGAPVLTKATYLESMNYTFESANLGTVPIIPDSVTSMDYCFYGTSGINLIDIKLPSSLTSMEGCFYNDYLGDGDLIIPPNVVNMNRSFYGVAGEIYLQVYNNPTSYTDIFETASDSFTITTQTDTGNRGKWKTIANNSTAYVYIVDEEVLTDNNDYLFSITSSTAQGDDENSGSLRVNTVPGDHYQRTSFGNIPSSVRIDGVDYVVVDMTSCFDSCMALVNAPIIPSSVRHMQNCFEDCYELKTVTISSGPIYLSSTFKNCTSLIQTPELPDTVEDMESCFEGCTSLQSATLPKSVTDLRNCFKNCTSLEGEIIVRNIPSYSENMFLNTVKDIEILDKNDAAPTIWEQVAAEYDNVYYVAYSIIDINANSNSVGFGKKTLSENSVVEFNWDTLLKKDLYFKEDDDLKNALSNLGWDILYGESKYLYIEAVDSTATFSLDRFMTEGTDISRFTNYVEPSFQYSYDALHWNNYTLGDQFNLGLGERVYFRGDNLNRWNDSYYDENYTIHYVYIMFNINNGRCKAGGNVMSLRYKNPTGDESIPCDYAFYYLFLNCTSLTTPPKLPAITLANYCYSNMFYNCTSLTTPPELPATMLATYCYGYMFYHCTSLTVAPNLPATTLAANCYYNMFNGCTSIITSPELPATTLANYCYCNMFYNCTSLTITPELPATTLATNCYNSMFYNCTSLTTPPRLPATELANACYDSMFSACTSLTVIPALPATTLASYCYYNMFTGIKANATSSSPCIYEYRIPYGTATGTIGTNSLSYMFTASVGGSFTPTINTTFYVSVPVQE